MKRHSFGYSRVVTALFALFLGVVLAAGLALPDRTFSPEENRNLAAFPKFSFDRLLSGDFQNDLQDYIADQFPLRDAMISLKARCEYLSGKQENNGVFWGKNQTLLRDYGQPDERRLRQNAQSVEQFAQNAGVPVSLSLVPTSTEIWRNRLPAAAQVRSEQDMIDAVRRQLTDARYLDCYTALAAQKDEDIFYRTDHHWTTRGAYFSYAALAEQMGLTPLPADAFEPKTITNDFNGTLYSRSGVRFYAPDSMETWVAEDGMTLSVMTDGQWQTEPVYARDCLEQKDKYSFFLGGNHPLAVLKNENAQSDRRLLIVRDSYADCQAPFWAQHFAQVHLADLRYFRQSLSDYVAENEIDEVLVLYGMATFPTDTNLAFLR